MSNNNSNLDDVLKASHAPDRSPGYWENFPKRVAAQLSAGAHPTAIGSASLIRLRSLGLAGACAVVLLCLSLWMKNHITTAQPDYTKLYHEIESMFPNQVRAIVVGQSGVNLDLSDKSDVPSSSPVRVDVCRNRQCLTYITFSGQSIRLNGEICDVLTDGQGHVVVAGQSIVWTSKDPTRRAGAFHIEAESLGAPS